MIYVVVTPAVGLVGVAVTSINGSAEVTGTSVIKNAENVEIIIMAVAMLDCNFPLVPFIFLLAHYLIYSPVHLSNIIRFCEVK
jgi:hypothetical protein